MSIIDSAKDILIERLLDDSEAIRQYFNAIGFNTSQFSNSLTLLLKDFIVFIRDKKFLIKDQLRTNLIFDTFPLSNHIIINNSPEFLKKKLTLFVSYFNLYKSGLTMMKIENENIKKKLGQALLITKNKLKSNKSELEPVGTDKKIDFTVITRDDKDRIYNFEQIRLEIQKLREYKQSLITRQLELSRKVKIYNEIPSDINLLRQLVEQRKSQYEKIKNIKSTFID